MQQTIEIEGKKVKIVSRRRHYMGNPCGYFVFINDIRYFVNCLRQDDARTRALARWTAGDLKGNP